MTYRRSFQLDERGGKQGPNLQTTTLWEYPSQHYGSSMQGDKRYIGATPSYVIWNLLHRYTKPGDKVVDPMCGSGTTIDVCADLGRQGFGFDIAPFRKDIQKSDARSLPLGDNAMDFAFLDPPYAQHLTYSGDDACIGELGPDDGYYEAMDQVIAELYRVLKPGGFLGLYVSDSAKKGRDFDPIGFELFSLMRKQFKAIDIVSVVRNNKKLKLSNWHQAAAEGNFFLRGFNYLFIMQKPALTAQQDRVGKPVNRRKKKRKLRP